MTESITFLKMHYLPVTKSFLSLTSHSLLSFMGMLKTKGRFNAHCGPSPSTLLLQCRLDLERSGILRFLPPTVPTRDSGKILSF